jgi:hypothetical protein
METKILKEHPFTIELKYCIKTGKISNVEYTVFIGKQDVTHILNKVDFGIVEAAVDDFIKTLT